MEKHLRGDGQGSSPQEVTEKQAHESKWESQ